MNCSKVRIRTTIQIPGVQQERRQWKCNRNVAIERQKFKPALTFNMIVINVWPSDCPSICDILSQKIMFILTQGSADFLSFHGNTQKSFISRFHRRCWKCSNAEGENKVLKYVENCPFFKHLIQHGCKLIYNSDWPNNTNRHCAWCNKCFKEFDLSSLCESALKSHARTAKHLRRATASASEFLGPQPIHNDQA